MLTPHSGLRKDPKAQAQGRKAVKSGRSFEVLLSQTHATYRHLGVGCVAKLHPETAGPPNARRFVGPGAVDCMGVVRRLDNPNDQEAVAFDTKSTKNCATWTLDTRPKAREVEQRQLRFLLDFARSGGLAFLLIYDAGLEVAFLIREDGIRELHDTGAVPLRAKQRDGTFTTRWNTVRLATAAEIARGAPPLDYRPELFRY